jgi:two-component sensor histidine kinase
VISAPTDDAASASASVQRLRESGATYRKMFDSIDQGFCVIEVLFDDQNHPVDYRFLDTNRSFEAQTGLKDAVGQTMRTLRPEHEAHWFEIYGQVALTGEAVRFENRAAALARWFDVYAFRVGAPEQHWVAILFSDITSERRDRERLALLSTEVDHRAKNMLMVVTSIVRLTQAETVPEYRSVLLGRLNALASSQRFLAESHWHGADLGKLIEDEMAAYRSTGDERVRWAGPPLPLGPAATQSVAMAVHELATNAIKYGALSVPDGRVAIEWRRRDDGQVSLMWSESGAPPIKPPTRRGIGTGVILRSIRDQLNGEVVFEWRPAGLRCELVVPTER